MLLKKCRKLTTQSRVLLNTQNGKVSKYRTSVKNYVNKRMK